MEVRYLRRPALTEPSMIAAWPGMGFIAKTAGDYLRRRLNAHLFAEIRCYQNAIVYRDSLAELSYVSHRFYSAQKENLVICVGDSQPSINEEAYRLARQIVRVAKKIGVRRIYTLAAYPNDYQVEPAVYGVYTNDGLRDALLERNIQLVDGEGAVNGLNGILIGVAKSMGIEGVCLMAEIKYTNFPQHLSSKAVLEKLASILGIEIDTAPLEQRAKRAEAYIRRRLGEEQEPDERIKKGDRELRYIS